jgi:hypothetical protein
MTIWPYDRVRARVLVRSMLAGRSTREGWRLTGVSHTTISGMRHGDRPGMAKVVDFARGLGGDVNELLRAYGYPEIAEREGDAMERQAVTSSNIASVGYDGAEQVLEVEFAGGSVYRYAGVSPEVHAHLVDAPSIGAFFAANVRGHYEFEKVEG